MFGPCSSAQPCTDLDVDLLGGRVGAGPAQPGPLHPLTDLVEVEGGAEAPGNTVVVHEIKSSRWDTETGEVEQHVLAHGHAARRPRVQVVRPVHDVIDVRSAAALCLVLVVAADPGHERAVTATRRLLPVLLSAERGEVQIGVGTELDVPARA